VELYFSREKPPALLVGRLLGGFPKLCTSEWLLIPTDNISLTKIKGSKGDMAATETECCDTQMGEFKDTNFDTKVTDHMFLYAIQVMRILLPYKYKEILIRKLI
jgi:hypothetical protein